MTKRRLIFMGAPGAGKGTQSKVIADFLKIPAISTGDIVRGHIKRNTQCAEKLKYYNDEGLLVPNEIMLGMVSQAICNAKVTSALSSINPKGGWILDGFPRNVEQVEDLDNLLLGMDEPSYNCVIYLDVPDDIVIARMVERAKQEDRRDSSKDVIQRRVEVYQQETTPLIQLYRDRKQLIVVNGNRTLEEITNELKQIVH